MRPILFTIYGPRYVRQSSQKPVELLREHTTCQLDEGQSMTVEYDASLAVALRKLWSTNKLQVALRVFRTVRGKG